MPYIGNITQDFNVSNAMLDTDSVTSIKIVDGTIEGADIAANLDLSDSQKIRFGAGNDLQIYHDGSNSYIDDTGTGDLNISGSIVRLQDSNRLTYCRGVQGGAFEIYFNNALKFETTSTGATVTGALATTSLSATGGITGTGGNFILGDSSGTSDDRIKLGAGEDLHVYHDGTDTYVSNATGDLRLFSIGGSADDVLIRAQDDIELQPNNGEAGIKVIGDGAVELYYDNTKRLETDASGVKLSNGRFYSAGTFAFIESSDTSTATLTLKKSASGADSIDYLQCRDSSNNIKLVISGSGDIDIEDNTKLKLGASDDLEIYHSGTDSYIENDTNQLYIRSAQGIYIQPATNENGVVALPNGGVELYYDNSKKFETTSSGVTVTGTVTATSFSGETVVGDPSPQLGNSLDMNGQSINGGDSAGAASNRIKLGASDDLQIYHDGNHSRILDDGTGKLQLGSDTEVEILNGSFNESMTKFQPNGAVELYYDNSKKFNTDSGGAQVFGILRFDDGSTTTNHLNFGNSADLKIFHDGTNSRINNTTGKLMLKDDNIEFVRQADDTVSFAVYEGGATDLYHNHNLRANTESYGFKIKNSNDSGAATLKLENNSTANNQVPRFDIAVDLANGKNGGSIQFVRANNYQSSAAADSEIVISPAKNDSNLEIVRITQDYIRLNSNSSGIQFNSDTAQANALNDYEEGTWTINPHDGTCTSFSTRYTKVGSNVTVWGRASGFSDTSTNDLVRLKGLPFNATSSNFATSCGPAMAQYINEDSAWVAFVEGDQIKFYGSSSSSFDQLRHNELNSGHEIYFSATYTTV